MMRPLAAGLAFSIACSCGWAADAGFQALAPSGSTLHAGGYTIDLGDGDSAGGAWQGPMRIATAGGKPCNVSEDVSIITVPMALVKGHLLYVSTYSGSVDQVYVVEAKDCSVKWTSPKFGGKPALSATGMRLAEAGRFRFGADGLPVK